MKPIILTTILTMVHLGIFAQDITEKTYKRWLYLDKNWKQIKDTSNHVYKRLTTISGNTNIHPMGAYGKDGYTLKKENDSSITDLKILDGTYVWYDKSGIKKSEHVFVNGEYIIGKEFWKNGKIKKQFDFTNHPKEDSLAYHVYFYNKKMTVLEVWTFQRDENGNWPRTR